MVRFSLAVILALAEVLGQIIVLWAGELIRQPVSAKLYVRP